MPHDRSVIWPDLLAQKQTWIASGYKPTHDGRASFGTTFGGPNHRNPQITQADFNTMAKDWVTKDDKTYNHTTVMSKGQEVEDPFTRKRTNVNSDNTWDFVCRVPSSLSSTGYRTFVYHVDVIAGPHAVAAPAQVSLPVAPTITPVKPPAPVRFTPRVSAPEWTGS